MVWELRTNTAAFRSPWGAVRTAERPASYWAATLRYTGLHGWKRAYMQNWIASCRGQANRFHVRDFSRAALRGGFSAPEMLTNSDFQSGTNGWSVGSEASVSSADGILRILRTANTGAANNYANQAISGLVEYAPYAFRVLVCGHRGTMNAGATAGAGMQAAGSSLSSLSASPALHTIHGVPFQTSNTFYCDNGIVTSVAGDYFEVGYTSLARCGMVDNGPNALLNSDTLGTTWTATRTTVSSNARVAPDGTSTADDIVDDATAAATHFLAQSGARANVAADVCAYGYFRQAVGSRNIFLAVGNDSTDYGDAFFDLSAGTVSNPTAYGAASEARAFIVPAGGPWYYCAVVVRVPAAATLEAAVYLTSSSSSSYDGDESSAISGWRLGAGVSSVPTRGGLTTSAATTGTAQTGAALHLKGLPVSTAGLLVQGDLAEIITTGGSQLVRARTTLNSNAAGLGYFEFEPPLRYSPADGAAVIVQKPMMRALLDSNSVKWTEGAGGFSDLEFTCVEDMIPP